MLTLLITLKKKQRKSHDFPQTLTGLAFLATHGTASRFLKMLAMQSRDLST